MAVKKARPTSAGRRFYVAVTTEGLHKGKRVKSNQARALILTPTRELAAQVFESLTTYSQFLDIKSACVFGGVNINPQMKKLRGGVDVLVATPGRLLDLMMN